MTGHAVSIATAAGQQHKVGLYVSLVASVSSLHPQTVKAEPHCILARPLIDDAFYLFVSASPPELCSPPTAG